MKSDYELLETYTKDKETFSYLRHKKTGLEISYHQRESAEAGFSFCFKTPVDNQYSGTAHVLEHCVLTGSKKYKVDFNVLKNFSLYSRCNIYTETINTVFSLSSFIPEECFKLIPVLADYLFFPELSEEAFMQECIRVEFTGASGSGKEKTELRGVIFNELKHGSGSASGGFYYKLQELNNEKIREYHKKYYRPDNCLFVFEGMSQVEEVLSVLDKFIPELEEAFSVAETASRKTFTCREFLEKVPFKKVPEKLKDSELAHWVMPQVSVWNERNFDPCKALAVYWLINLSPVMPFVLDEKYAYTAITMEDENFKFPEKMPKPAKKTIQQIKADLLSRNSLEEYKNKLEKLHLWQNRDVKKMAAEIMGPLAAKEYDIKLSSTEEIVKKQDERFWKSVAVRNDRFSGLELYKIRNSYRVYFSPSKEFTREFYAEFAYIIFLQNQLITELRKAGLLYQVNCDYTVSKGFSIFTDRNDRPAETLKYIKQIIAGNAAYNFTELDLCEIKSVVLSNRRIGIGYSFVSDDIFTVKPEELHKAAERFSKLSENHKKSS